jgi:hypothetical protein
MPYKFKTLQSNCPWYVELADLDIGKIPNFCDCDRNPIDRDSDPSNSCNEKLCPMLHGMETRESDSINQIRIKE